MKTASVKEPSVITIQDISMPHPGPGEILVQMQACGICGSDVEKVFGQYGKTSMKLGHEPAGIITAVGEGVCDFAPGDRVFTHHHVSCNACHLCAHDNHTLCPKYSQTNLYPCGLSEQYMVPQSNVAGGVLKIPDQMSFEEAAMIEPLACCLRAWNKLRFKENDSIAVFGTGPTGMMHAMLAQSKGFAGIFCLDVNDFRLDFAKKLQVTQAIHSTDPRRREIILQHTGNRGVDIAIVATSSLDALKDAIDIVRSGGAVMMFGVPSKNAMMSIDMSKVYSKEISLYTSYAASDADTRAALELISSSQIDVTQLITHTYPISESQTAFDHARTGKDAMKIIITK